ncbi:MAG TPA: diguanylate cyclase, partial [Acinetobacter sp.]|nr:diguanylate cyclase [Acinetobacter sp.]
MNLASSLQFIHQMNETQQKVFNSIPSLVWLLTEQGDAYFFNKISQEYLGFHESESLVKEWMELIHLDDLDVFQS